MSGHLSADDLPLHRIYRWERERPESIFLTQPHGGKVRDWTWGQSVAEIRRIAAWLKAQDWERLHSRKLRSFAEVAFQ